MPPSLAELQRRMRDTALGGDAEAPGRWVVSDGLAPEARLGLHRNNTVLLLTEALAANFPVTRALVGETFFAAACRVFVRAQPPRAPVMADYGADFPAFLEAMPQMSPVPYVGDVARLERARIEALRAPEAAVLSPDALALVAAEDAALLRLTMHPAARVVASPWPVAALWRAHQPDAPEDALTALDLDGGGETVLVTRPVEVVHLTVLSPGAAPPVEALAGGAPLVEAWAAAPDTDLGAVLAALLTAGGVADLDIMQPPETPSTTERSPDP